MKLTRLQLISLIREQFLQEITPGIIDPSQGSASAPVSKDSEIDRSTADTAATQASYMTGGSPRIVLEIALGFTPVGIAIDTGYLAWALYNRDAIGAVLAGIGFIPFFGDTFKGFKETLESGKKLSPSQIKSVEEAIDAVRKTESPGETAKLKTRADASRAVRAVRISDPAIETLDDGSLLKAKYTVDVDDASYDVVFAKKSHGAPIDISFNVAGKGTEYAMTDARHPLRLVSGVTDTFKDLHKRFPDEKSFQFTGYVGEVDRLNFGATGDQVSKRTKVFNGLIQRALRRDSSIKIQRMGDLGWAGDPNTIKITLKELKRIISEVLLLEAL